MCTNVMWIDLAVGLAANLLHTVVGTIHDASAATVPMSSVRMRSWMRLGLLSTAQHRCRSLLKSHRSSEQSGR